MPQLIQTGWRYQSIFAQVCQSQSQKHNLAASVCTMFSVFQDRFVYMCALKSVSQTFWSPRQCVEVSDYGCQLLGAKSFSCWTEKRIRSKHYIWTENILHCICTEKIVMSKHYICPTRRCKIINSRWSQSLSHLLWLNRRDQMPHEKHYPSTDCDFELHIIFNFCRNVIPRFLNDFITFTTVQILVRALIALLSQNPQV